MVAILSVLRTTALVRAADRPVRHDERSGSDEGPVGASAATATNAGGNHTVYRETSESSATDTLWEPFLGSWRGRALLSLYRHRVVPCLRLHTGNLQLGMG